MVGEGERSIRKLIDDGERLPGLELHEDGVEEGDELPLALKVEVDQLLGNHTRDGRPLDIAPG